MTAPFLSIIIPAYNEEQRLPATLEQIHQYLEAQPYQAEILVVENGSVDRTFEIAQEIAASYPNIRVIRADGRGKGLAISNGMLAATGDYRFMCDADLSMPISEISKFLPPHLDKLEIAIGSREAPGAVRYNEPCYRHWGGRGINLIIRLLALPGLNDTQCGFKMFRGDVAEKLFPYLSITNWSFDIELLYIARLHGYQIKEVPIQWYFDPETKLSPVKDALQMVVDILSMHWNRIKGKYSPAV